MNWPKFVVVASARNRGRDCLAVYLCAEFLFVFLITLRVQIRSRQQDVQQRIL